MAPVWVVGAHGLLGAAVTRRLRAGQSEAMTTPVRWSSPTSSLSDLKHGVHELWKAGGQPSILWCAGAGVPSSPDELFRQEILVFRGLLDELRTAPPPVLRALRFFYASSAGAVHAGVGEPPYDETSPVRPLASYGHAKLAMEAVLRRFTADTGARAVVGRISNLYGPGQDLTKSQGLASTLLMSGLTRSPVQIYVSLDTIRDYLYVSDAAALVLACLDRLNQVEAGCCITKVLCSGQATSISSLLGLVRQVMHRRPLIVQGASGLTRVQSRNLSVGSVVWPDIDATAHVPMIDGLGRTYRDLSHRFCTGR